MCLRLLYHRFKYYVLADPEMSDYDYDVLEKELVAFEVKHPLMIHPKSPGLLEGSDRIEDYPNSILHLCKNHPMFQTVMTRQGLKWGGKQYD